MKGKQHDTVTSHSEHTRQIRGFEIDFENQMLAMNIELHNLDSSVSDIMSDRPPLTESQAVRLCDIDGIISDEIAQTNIMYAKVGDLSKTRMDLFVIADTKESS